MPGSQKSDSFADAERVRRVNAIRSIHRGKGGLSLRTPYLCGVANDSFSSRVHYIRTTYTYVDLFRDKMLFFYFDNGTNFLSESYGVVSDTFSSQT